MSASSESQLFMTHHGPVGAWASLAFGAANMGLSLQIEGLEPEANADLLVGVRRKGKDFEALPFVRRGADYPCWRFVSAGAMARKLSVCVDEFSAAGAGITLRVFTPQAALPNPKRSGNLQFATAPGVLMELVIDNSESDVEATGFIGIAGGCRRMRPVDWSSKTLCGIGNGSRWILAATPVKGEIYTIQADDLGDFSPKIDPHAVRGGIGFKVAPRSVRTLTLSFAAFLPGMATQGIDASYFYAQYFPRVEAVANFMLQNGQRIRESCASFDARATGLCGEPSKLALLSRGVRSYNARSQVLDAQTPAGPAAYFATLGGDGRRNPLEGVTDRLPWELFRNPWVIRNLFDLATTSYAYHDKVRFPCDAGSAEELRDGGATFARDFGCYSTYAPSAVPAQGAGQSGISAFDGAGGTPGWSGGAFGTEILLNASYMLTSYALLADDTPWAKTRLPFARDLLRSLEARDHWDPAQRTGILKAESTASPGSELTSLPGGDPVLTHARGNLYVAVKTFCANLLLTTYYQSNNDLHSADYSYSFAQKTAAALTSAFNQETQLLPANLLGADFSDRAPRLLAALEPLALPTYLGLTSTLSEYFPELFAALKAHAAACLQPAPQGCLDGTTLRLASNVPTTDAGKVIAILFVLERLFQIPAPAGVWENLTQQPTGDSLTAALFLRTPPAA